MGDLEIWAFGVHRFLGYTHDVRRLEGERKSIVDSVEQRERATFMRQALLTGQPITANAKVGANASLAITRISKC